MDCHYNKYCYLEKMKMTMLTKLLHIKNFMNFLLLELCRVVQKIWKLTYHTCVKNPYKI
jgi:hypothetical protein